MTRDQYLDWLQQIAGLTVQQQLAATKALILALIHLLQFRAR